MKRNRKLITLRLVSALELPDWKRVIVRLLLLDMENREEFLRDLRARLEKVYTLEPATL